MHRKHFWQKMSPAIVAVVVLSTAAAGSSEPTAAINQPMLFAQAGSTGGTIGKQDKSASGGEVRVPRARRTLLARKHHAPARERRVPLVRQHHVADRKELLPKTIRLNEHSWVGNFFITLQKIRGNVYEGTYNVGVATKFTITSWTKDAVRMERNDHPGLFAVKATYTGHRTGNSANGQATGSDGGTGGTWDASW